MQSGNKYLFFSVPGFSQMNLVKDNFRTTLSNTNLNNLLNININGSSLQNFDPANSIDKWYLEGGQKHIRTPTESL